MKKKIRRALSAPQNKAQVMQYVDSKPTRPLQASNRLHRKYSIYYSHQSNTNRIRAKILAGAASCRLLTTSGPEVFDQKPQ